MPLIEPVLHAHSVSMLRRVSPDAYDEPGSGSLIGIGERLFIATAGHVIPHDPNGSNLWVLNRRPRNPFTEGVPEFLRFRRVRPWPDIGYLELSHDLLDDYLDVEPCPISRLRCVGWGRDRRHVALLGNPQQFVRVVRTENSRGIVPTTHPFLSTPLRPDEWPMPTGHDDPPTQIETDLFLDYPSDGTSDIRTGDEIHLETAQGYSGGGFWDLGFEPGEVWGTDHIFLFGIECCWSATQRYVRGIQLHHWLRLIHEDYEDLRPLLEDHFPELAEEGSQE